MNKIDILFWVNWFLILLKMNLSKEDYEALTSLINKAHKNMLEKHYDISNARKFMEAHNRGADALNEHYEEWNKEYDSLYGTKPNEDRSSYFRFISQKQNEILKKIPDDFFELFTDPEFGECSICGRLKHVNNNDVKIQIMLKAVE